MSALHEKDPNTVAPSVTHVPAPVIDWSRVTGAPSSENTVSNPKKAAPKPAPPSKKRKSDAQDEDIKAIMFPEGVVYPDDNDRRIQPTEHDTCGRTRQKIRKWIESGAMKVGEFQDELGVSGPAYGRFMSRTGTWDGEYTDTYVEAVRFFKKREIAGLPLAVPNAKRAKTTVEKKQAELKGTKREGVNPLLDTGSVKLDGEDACNVSIYMTPNEVRKGLRALLNKGVTQAALHRALSKQYPEDSGRSVSAANLRYFMGQTGVEGGLASTAFYAGYCLLEKLRIRASKPKSDFREEMEKVHGPAGLSTEPNSAYVTVMSGEDAYIDKYGSLQITRSRY